MGLYLVYTPPSSDIFRYIIHKWETLQKDDHKIITILCLFFKKEILVCNACNNSILTICSWHDRVKLCRIVNYE